MLSCIFRELSLFTAGEVGWGAKCIGEKKAFPLREYVGKFFLRNSPQVLKTC